MRIWEDSFQTFFYFFFSSTRRHPFSFHKLRTTSVGFLLKRSKTNHFQSFWYQYLIFRHSHVESCLEYGFYLYTRTCMKPNIMENTLVIVGRVQPCESIWAISAMWDSEIMGDFPFLKRKKNCWFSWLKQINMPNMLVGYYQIHGTPLNRGVSPDGGKASAHWANFNEFADQTAQYRGGPGS